MKKDSRAANDVKFARSLDLQMFNEEDPFEPVEPETQVEPEGNEPIEPVQPNESNDPNDPPAEPAPEDLTKTQAFAKRLKEETDRVRQAVWQEARDKVIAEQYEGVTWKGMPILTEADLTQALYEQELEKAGVEDVDLSKLINEHPDVKAARLQKEETERRQQLFTEWSELSEEHKDIKEISQIPEEVFRIRKERGIPLLDAFNRYRIKNIKQETEQEIIRKIKENELSSPGSAFDGGVEHKTKPVDEMTPEEFEAYREEVKNRTKG